MAGYIHQTTNNLSIIAITLNLHLLCHEHASTDLHQVPFLDFTSSVVGLR